MVFTGFTAEDFKTFEIDGLESRMKAIQTRIQPKFQTIGHDLTDYLSAELGIEMFLHIAKHARRTKNPPNDTWLAIAANRRGYKKHPHFQVGLFDDRVFIWLAFIYELPSKQEIAKTFQQNIDSIQLLPSNFVISQDHMKKEATPIKELNLPEVLKRFHDVKKAELLIGRQIESTSAVLKDGQAFITSVKATFESLIPLYHLAFNGIQT